MVSRNVFYMGIDGVVRICRVREFGVSLRKMHRIMAVDCITALDELAGELF